MGLNAIWGKCNMGRDRPGWNYEKNANFTKNLNFEKQISNPKNVILVGLRLRWSQKTKKKIKFFLDSQKSSFWPQKQSTHLSALSKPIFWTLWLFIFPSNQKLDRPNESKSVKNAKRPQVVEGRKFQNSRRDLKFVFR